MGNIIKAGDPPRVPFALKTKDSEAIKPGMLLAISSGEWAKHAGGDAVPVYVADQYSNADIDTAIPDDVTPTVFQLTSGCEASMWLSEGNDTVAGVTRLESDADGNLKVYVEQDAEDGLGAAVNVNTNSIVGVAMETITNNVLGAVPVRIRVRRH